jgi:fluoride ion exporter CrcB/FEX
MSTLLLVAHAGAAGAAARYAASGDHDRTDRRPLGSLAAGLTAVTLGVYVGRALL